MLIELRVLDSYRKVRMSAYGRQLWARSWARSWAGRRARAPAGRKVSGLTGLLLGIGRDVGSKSVQFAYAYIRTTFVLYSYPDMCQHLTVVAHVRVCD